MRMILKKLIYKCLKMMLSAVWLRGAHKEHKYNGLGMEYSLLHQLSRNLYPKKHYISVLSFMIRRVSFLLESKI